ncbi:hypothetical protein ACHAXT_005996 [Thalassiosira profunda]
MAPIAACIHKPSKDARLGIGLINRGDGPVVVSSIAAGSLFASTGLAVGMQVLSINNIPLDGATSGQAIQLLKDAEGQVAVVADNPVQAAVVASSTAVQPSAPAASSIATGRKRGYIILKKTFKVKPSGFSFSTLKSYSFHGPFGHFHSTMNHNAQKYHEEDFVVVILEAMEELGYYFRFQYDAEAFSTKMTGDSYTAKELFIFHKMQE